MSHEPQTTDPLQVFPYEIWLEIIAFAIVDSTDGPLPFLAVSSKWSETILSTPSLWTTVVLDQGEDEFARIHSFLFLSQKLPLDVLVPLPFSDRTSLARLAQEASRIASLSISGKHRDNQYSSHQASEILEQVFKDGQPYLEMKFLEVDPQFSPVLPENFLQNCPHLCYFQCTPQYESFGFIPPAKALQFYQHPNLHSLSLNYRNFINDAGAWVEHLEQLALTPTGRLRELTIVFPCERVTIISLLLKSLPQLHTLDLQFYIGHDALPNTPSFNPSDISGLRNLSISCLPSHSYPVQMWCGWVMRLFTEHTALINLETLSFENGDSPCDATQLNTLLCSAINVRVLRVKLGGADSRMETIPVGLQVPSLRNLYSVTLFPAFLINHLTAPNAIHVSLDSLADLQLTKAPKLGTFISRLIISSVEFDNVNKDLSPTTMETRWGALRSIQLSSQYAGKSAASLTSLQVVEFSRPRNIGAYLPGLNGFLLELLKSRGSCPRLVAIKSSDYPCWGLLSEVLRRRISSQLCRITHVTLPAYPILPILSRLVSLLQGDSGHVGWEDIDGAIMRRFQEHADDSCIFCIQSGCFNCSYSKPEYSPARYALTHDWPPDPPIKWDHDLGTVRNDDMDWEVALQSLGSVINGRGHGWNACSQHAGRAEISEYTLKGIPFMEHIWSESNKSGNS